MSLIATKSTSTARQRHSVNTYSTFSYGSRPETIQSTRFERSKTFAGSNPTVCKTDAEYKANKLNRTEEVKLRNLTFQVGKAQEIQRRQYQHTANILRVKSAKLATRIKGIEDNWALNHQKTTAKHKLLDRGGDSQLSTGKCTTCAQLQTIVEMYEREGCDKGLINRINIHSTCMFSNGQINVFLKMLEAKYLQEIPGLKLKLRDSDVTSIFVQTQNEPKLSKRQVDTRLALRDVEMRIRKFCVDLERFNKIHGTVSKDVRETVERVRLSNAVVKRSVEPERINIKEEVERILKL